MIWIPTLAWSAVVFQKLLAEHQLCFGSQAEAHHETFVKPQLQVPQPRTTTNPETCVHVRIAEQVAITSSASSTEYFGQDTWMNKIKPC
jgi:hypothetical protein